MKKIDLHIHTISKAAGENSVFSLDTLKKYNFESNLKETDVTEVVKRVKLLITNSKKEILLGYSHSDYQFPGGHVEKKENLVRALKREVHEETGINLNIKNIIPFAEIIGYYKDWPSIGKNRKIEIYYYEIKTDEKPNLDETKYTESEKDGNFELKYVPLTNIKQILKENAKKYGDKKGIVKEMIQLFDIYNSIKNNKD